jgi:hypothetical protein
MSATQSNVITEEADADMNTDMNVAKTHGQL